MISIFWDGVAHWVWQLNLSIRYKFPGIFKALVAFLKKWFKQWKTGKQWFNNTAHSSPIANKTNIDVGKVL